MTRVVRCSDLIADLDALLEIDRFDDLGPNGLQVPGNGEISRVATGVSASRTLIETAIERGAQLIVVHHGLFWSFNPAGIAGVLAERLRPLFKHDVALAGYHLPLDAHPEHGNNAILAELLGSESHDPFGVYMGRAVGRVATFAGAGAPIGELVERVRRATGREPLVQGAGPERVRKLGIVSGSAADNLYEAAELGFDAFLTGEPREHVHRDAAELGLHFIAAGHYATETFGVRRLGDRLQERFGIEHLWIDEPNPV